MTLKAEMHSRRVIMAKKIKDENGNTYVQKKPFYKRVWFWVLAIILIIVIGSAIGGGSSFSDSSSTSSKTEQSSSKSSSTSSKPKTSATNLAALASAKTYADTMHMSKQGIYDQLTSDAGDKFKPEAAQYAVDHLKADYNKNALEAAKSYQKDQNMSPEAIRDQLTSQDGDKFTDEQADYAVQNLPK